MSDPAKGRIKLNREEFARKWIKKIDKDKGVLMALDPQADFYQRQEGEKLDRRKTFEHFLGYFRNYKKSFVHLFAVIG